jgi:putative nucleotidyltransferase with HDIG domain
VTIRAFLESGISISPKNVTIRSGDLYSTLEVEVMAKVLLMGPDRERTTGIRSLLRQDGHQVNLQRSVDGWRGRERSLLPELVIAAVDSTDRVLSDRGPAPRGFPAPLLFVQHGADFFRDLHLNERLVDRIASPFMSEDLLGRVDALVRVRRVIQRDPSLMGGRTASADVDPGTAAGRLRGLGGRFAALLGARIPRYAKPLGAYLEVAARVADWADRRDAFEPGHAERVTSFCAMMAEALDVDDHNTASLLRAAMLHDIGKVALPVEVLHQTTPLQDSQIRLIRTHPRKGAALLRALDRDDEVADTILYHHERPDGNGYYGLEQGDIPLSARILAVAEVYDAMTSSKVRKPLAADEALHELHGNRGQSLDGECVEALVDKLTPRSRSIPFAPQS